MNESMNWTIEELADVLNKEIKKGNGKKKIMLSNDDEGNGYHEMFYGVSPAKRNYFGYGVTPPYGVSVAEAVKEYFIIA